MLQVSAPGTLMLRLLGPFEIVVNGQTLSHPRARAGEWILALLTLHQKRPVERVWLASLLWPDSSHEQALYNLRRNLTDLRQLLGNEANRLTAPTPRTLHLNLDGAKCDILEFDSLLQRTDSAALREAVALYRGPLLEGCLENWVLQERAAREQAYLTALETLANRALQEKNYQEAIAYLRQVLAVDAYREPALCNLLQALAEAGDFVAATLAYREFRLRLHQDLRAEPAPETQAIYHSVQHRGQQRPEPLLSSRPPASQRASLLRLPQPISGFIGRQEERGQVSNCLEKARLVTLTGSGGVGKTRLAVAAAEEMTGDFQDGIWFVDLSPLSEAALVPFTIARSLGLEEAPVRATIETLLQHLISKELLLILDNCEHLIEACVGITRILLQACPALRILATSRQALGLSGELVWRVPSLVFPGEEKTAEVSEESGALAVRIEQFDALRLFAERASESCPSFTLNSHNIATVARICQRLDGIPLAIELAAARMRFLPLEEIYTRLRTNFRLLRGSSMTLPRQETLAATFAWSWDLLTLSERLLLAQLSVFAGGWTLAAAEAICSGDGQEQTEVIEMEVIDLLLALVDKSLVVYMPPETEADNLGIRVGEARYSLLETTRQFAAERLTEIGMTETMKDRHRDYFLAWAESIHSKLWGAEQGWWFARLETEYHNLRAALEWSREQGAIEQEFRFVVTLGRFWDTHGHLREGFRQLKTTLARVTPDLRPELHADALVNAGWMANVLGDTSVSRLYYEQALALCQRIGYEFHLPGVLNLLAASYSGTGDFTKARVLFEEANNLCLRLRKPSRRTAVLNNLGMSLLRQGEFAAARTYLEEGVALCTKIGANQMLGITLHNLAIAASKEGHCEEALAHNAASLRVHHAGRALINIPEAIDLMAVLACQLAQWERAACLFGAAEGLHRTLSIPPEMTLISDLAEAGPATQRALGPDVFAVKFSEGLAMTMEEAVSYALEQDFG